MYHSYQISLVNLQFNLWIKGKLLDKNQTLNLLVLWSSNIISWWLEMVNYLVKLQIIYATPIKSKYLKKNLCGPLLWGDIFFWPPSTVYIS